jgi:hypothetical protein
VKAEQRKLIKRNERLAKKLAKLWQEERGKALFQQLTKQVRLEEPTPMIESALAQALRAAGFVPDDGNLGNG